MMRCVPNSSTMPVSTLKTVPASATSSPMIKTRASRRISSLIASRIASEKVNIRPFVLFPLGVDMAIHLLGGWIGGVEGKFDGGAHFLVDARGNLLEDRSLR